MVSDDAREIERQLARVSEVHGLASKPAYTLLGNPDQITQKLLEYRTAGLDGFIACFAEPFDTRTIELLAKEVRPRLAAS